MPLRTPAPRPPTARTHVAWLSPRIADRLVCGQKTVESRLSRVRGPAFGRVAAGDTIYFRQTGGGYRAVATVQHASHISGLTPAGVRALRALLGPAVAADAAYWRLKARSRYATLLWLSDVRLISAGPDCEAWPGFSRRAGWASSRPAFLTPPRA